MTHRRHPERDEQANIVQLLRTLGAQVWTLGTTRKRGDWQGTRMSPGLPDVLAFLPNPYGGTEKALLVIEAKAPGGRLRPEQAQFRCCCADANVAHVWGGLDDVTAWLLERGYLQRDQIAHDRLPKEARA